MLTPHCSAASGMVVPPSIVPTTRLRRSAEYGFAKPAGLLPADSLNHIRDAMGIPDSAFPGNALGVAKRPHPTTPTRIVSQRPLSRIIRADPKEPRRCPAETVSSRSSRWPASVGSHRFRHSNLWRCGCSLLDLRCDCAHAPGLLVLSVMQLLLS